VVLPGSLAVVLIASVVGHGEAGGRREGADGGGQAGGEEKEEGLRWWECRRMEDW
jgi:hypothetical protein